MSGGLSRRVLLARLARLLAVAAVAGLIIVSVPELGSLRARLGRADLWWAIAAAGLEAGSVLSFATAFRRTFAGRLDRREAVSLALTAQAVNVLVPAGGTGGLAAVSVVMARRGLERAYVVSRMVALFVLAGVLTNIALVIVAGLGVAGGALPGAVSPALSLLPALFAGGLVAAVAGLMRRSSPRPDQPVPGSRWHPRVARAAIAVRDGVSAGAALIRSRDPILLGGAAGYVLCDLGALAAAFRSVGSVGLPVGTMALAYTLGQIGSVVSLPGTTEGGLVGVFALYGAPLGASISAVIVYRAAQSLVPLALGTIGIAGLRLRPSPPRPPGGEVIPAAGDLALDGRARRG